MRPLLVWSGPIRSSTARRKWLVAVKSSCGWRLRYASCSCLKSKSGSFALRWWASWRSIQYYSLLSSLMPPGLYLNWFHDESNTWHYPFLLYQADIVLPFPFNLNRQQTFVFEWPLESGAAIPVVSAPFRLLVYDFAYIIINSIRRTPAPLWSFSYCRTVHPLLPILSCVLLTSPSASQSCSLSYPAPKSRNEMGGTWLGSSTVSSVGA